MDFNIYQNETKRTMNFTGTETEIVSNMCMGIAGEAGEVVDYIKKVLYHGKELDCQKLSEEIGDLLWYISALCNKANIKMDDIVFQNIIKLQKRYPNGFSKERSNNREE
jgi:NTP pyrophosphatase (non-canonical NTP hydrolase)